MSSTLRTLALAVAAGLTLTSASTHAAAQTPPTIHVNVPFDFEVANTHFAAGPYTVRSIVDNFLRLQSDQSSKNAQGFGFVRALSPRTADLSKAVFHCYGSRCFLRELRIEGRQDYLTVPASKAEKNVQREELLAQAHKPDPQKPELASVSVPAR